MCIYQMFGPNRIKTSESWMMFQEDFNSSFKSNRKTKQSLLMQGAREGWKISENGLP